MKGLPIKFRGKDIRNGKYVFGDLIHGFDDEWKYNENVTRIAFGNGFNEIVYVEVDPETVAQLVGYDAEGNEVYEGDEIKVGNEVMKVYWNNFQTCVCVDWSNDFTDSYGIVSRHYLEKPYLIKKGKNNGICD